MNKDTLKGQWKQLKGQVRKQWGKLTDDDLDQIHGDAEILAGKIQERYGHAKDEGAARSGQLLQRPVAGVRERSVMARHRITASFTVGTVLLAALAAGGCGESPSSSATNTAVNARDRDGTTATPADQSNSAADLELASRIRKALVADESLSTNAKNVKIVTVNGDVTLRGLVNDGREREAVIHVAKQVAGHRNVVDNLDVAQP